MESSFSPKQVEEFIEVLRKIENHLGSIAASTKAIADMIPPISGRIERIALSLQGIVGKNK